MSEQICFIICPIGDEGSETRKRSDQVLKHIIKPAAEVCGYSAIRADEISEPGLISSQIIQHIVDDPLVIADLTERNPNVFYELALRHALRKPLVQIISKGDQIPFDVAGMRTISVDHHDLDSVEEARKEIISQIKAVEAKGSEDIDTPISVSLELQLLKQSENPEERSLGDILSVVSELASTISSLEKRLSNPSSILPPDYLVSLMRETRVDLSPLNERYYFEIRHLLERILKSESLNRDSEEYNDLVELIEGINFVLHKHRHSTGSMG